MSNKRLRRANRWLHLFVGIMLIVYIYSPLGEVSWYALAVQALAIPLVVLSGVALWQQPRLSAWLKRRRS